MDKQSEYDILRRGFVATILLDGHLLALEAGELACGPCDGYTAALLFSGLDPAKTPDTRCQAVHQWRAQITAALAVVAEDLRAGR